MTDVTATPRPSRLHTLAVVLCSLLIPVPLLVGRLVEGVLDTLNPADVDVTQPLAYLREILGFGFGSLGVIVVAIVVVLVLQFRRGGGFAAIRLPLTVLVVQIVVGVLTLAFSALANT
jgi:ABC-type Fe3+-siderophore transport system permease subunit